jgi:preprotein translocase subunit SecE
MSEQKTKQGTVKKEKPGFFARVINFFKHLPANIAKPFINTWHELRKVTWPTRQNLINSTLIVLLFMVFMGVVIGLLDMGSTEVVKLLSRWAA